MLIAHRIALDSNNAQATYLARAGGTARFAYNWALAEWKRQCEGWKVDNSLPKPTQAALRRQLSALKREVSVDARSHQERAADGDHPVGPGVPELLRGPRPLPAISQKGIPDRFTITNDQFSVDGSRIRIPNLGWVRMRETLRFTGKIMSATVSRVADKWFVSIAVDTRPQAPQGAAGPLAQALALLEPRGRRVSLWRGRLWPASQDKDETGLGEAESQR